MNPFNIGEEAVSKIMDMNEIQRWLVEKVFPSIPINIFGANLTSVEVEKATNPDPKFQVSNILG
jgi:hypothetical protein